MGYSIDFVSALDDDLERLHHEDPDVEALWLEVVDLVYDVESIAYELTLDRGYNPRQPCFDTVPIGELLRLGFNIGRIKLYPPDGGPALRQRLLYALDHRRSPGTIWLLGLMPRKVDYDPKDPFIARVLRDYRQLGIPLVPRG